MAPLHAGDGDGGMEGMNCVSGRFESGVIPSEPGGAARARACLGTPVPTAENSSAVEGESGPAAARRRPGARRRFGPPSPVNGRGAHANGDGAQRRRGGRRAPRAAGDNHPFRPALRSSAGRGFLYSRGSAGLARNEHPLFTTPFWRRSPRRCASRHPTSPRAPRRRPTRRSASGSGSRRGRRRWSRSTTAPGPEPPLSRARVGGA